VELDIRLLGPVEVLRSGRGIDLPGQSPRCVLASLALSAGTTVSVDRLADALWLDAPPRTSLTQIQAQVATLRRLLDPDHPAGSPGELLVTRAPGYRLEVALDTIDVFRFEAALREGRDLLAANRPEDAIRRLQQALALWRGPALADLPGEQLGRDSARLEDLRLAALELRVGAELDLGMHAQVVEELTALCAENPFRESLREKLMLALYAAGRQAEALAVFRSARDALVGQLGIEPSERLRDLERAILRHDPKLLRESRDREPSSRRVLVCGRPEELRDLARLAAPFALDELIVVGVSVEPELAATPVAASDAFGQGRGVSARYAAFRTRHLERDLARLAKEQEVELLVVSLPPAGVLPQNLLEACPADVALVQATAAEAPEALRVPFSGSTHDWAALALAGRYAAVRSVPIELVGVDAGAAGDASRILANAAIALQRTVGVDAAARLIPAGARALAAVATADAMVVCGLSDGYRRNGLGPARHALAEAALGDVVFVCAGLRPGTLAPADSGTRFTWSLAAAADKTS